MLLILLQVALLFTMSVDSTTETDLSGLHFNMIAFQVSCRIHLNMNKPINLTPTNTLTNKIKNQSQFLNYNPASTLRVHLSMH